MKLRDLLLVISLVTLAACASPSRTQYYTLSDRGPGPDKTADSTAAYQVSIGPVSVPETLDRSQLVLRVAPNRYLISDSDHWLAPLKYEIPRVLVQEIGQGLPHARVAERMGQGADYRVSLDVLRFESVPGESVAFEATWNVRNRAGIGLRKGHFFFEAPVKTPGVSPLVSAHAKALAELGREIAEAVDALVQAK